jgi:hypothetical protein
MGILAHGGTRPACYSLLRLALVLLAPDSADFLSLSNDSSLPTVISTFNWHALVGWNAGGLVVLCLVL